MYNKKRYRKKMYRKNMYGKNRRVILSINKSTTLFKRLKPPSSQNKSAKIFLSRSVKLSMERSATFNMHSSITRAGHVPTFLKLFRSVLERGPSAKLFRSRSSFFFFYRSVLVPFRPVPSRSEQKNSLPVPFHSWRSQLKNGCIPLVLFLIKKVSIPRSVLSNKQLHPRQKFYRKELVKK